MALWHYGTLPYNADKPQELYITPIDPLAHYYVTLPYNADKPQELYIPPVDPLAHLQYVISRHLYQCANEDFIWEINECDGIKHCHDGTDELNCKFIFSRVD